MKYLISALSTVIIFLLMGAIIRRKPTERNSILILILGIAAAICSVVIVLLPKMENIIGHVDDAWMCYPLSVLFILAAICCLMSYCGEYIKIIDDKIIYRNWLFKTTEIKKADIAEWNIKLNGDIKIKMTNGSSITIGKTIGKYDELESFLLK